MLPPLGSSGLLPPGVHAALWSDVLADFGGNACRLRLLSGLLDAVHMLAAAGCTAMWLDGSFVTAKPEPGDYDACWDWHGVDPDQLDPLLRDFSVPGRAARKAKYLGDLFPAGIETGTGLAFVDFFQRTRDDEPKGIVLLNPRETP